jgi:hypothetical protein
MAAKGSGWTLKKDRLPELDRDLAALVAQEVLVGFPEDTTGRKDEDNSGITNAALGYIHNNGQPDKNIPARPFMEPGIAEAQDALASTLGSVAKRFLRDGNKASIDQGFHRLGLKAQYAMRRKINEGIPPPLSDATLRQRAGRKGKGRKGAKLELELRAAGWTPSTDFAKPLIDTGQLRNAINYVVRPRKARKR